MAKLARVPTHSSGGCDWYVATSDKDWPAAIERMQAAVREREARMTAWERERSGQRTGGDYWAAYRAEKYRVSIEYPMPIGHVMFG